MTVSKSLRVYLKSAKERRKAGNPSGLPDELNISLSEALSLLASRSEAYKDTAIVRAKDQISDPALSDVAGLCVRFGDLLAPICDFMMATSGYPLSEILSPVYDLNGINRKRSMVGTALWTCEKFQWPVSKSGAPLSPLMQINLQELYDDISGVADFPSLLVQVWGDQFKPIVRTIPLSEIDISIPDMVVPDWENEHLHYAVRDDATGAARDVEGCAGPFMYAEYISAGAPRNFTVCRSVYSFESIRYEIEEFIENDLSSKSDAYDDALELVQYLSDCFEEAMERFEESYSFDETGSGYFFGDIKLRQSSYDGWFSDNEGWQGSGWKLLYSPCNKGENPPGISIFWDGQMALFWRIKDGQFEFRAEADR
jgi:hypothetical protein